MSILFFGFVVEMLPTCKLTFQLRTTQLQVTAPTRNEKGKETFDNGPSSEIDTLCIASVVFLAMLRD